MTNMLRRNPRGCARLFGLRPKLSEKDLMKPSNHSKESKYHGWRCSKSTLSETVAERTSDFAR